VLEALGVDIMLPPEGVSRCVEEAGMGFLFAPAFHPATKFAAIPRRELGVRTVFNLLGPLTNPARPSYQLLGVSNGALVDLLAESLLKLGVERALVVHSADGTDEISVSGPTTVREVTGGSIRRYELTPEEFGVEPSPQDAVRGGDPQTNAAILTGILEGHRGPARDAAIVNAAAALYAAGRAESARDGAQIAQRAIDSGAAMDTLERLRAVSHGAREEVRHA
jgi:anthranilate phosphoribosyltransferase